MSELIVVQMHGEPGSGKSELAKAISPRIPAVVIDKDAIASAMMATGIDARAASGAAYEVMRELACELLAANQSVVWDSPCGWPIIEEKGRAIAERFGVPWAMVECACPEDLVDKRLASREARVSQPRQREDWFARPGSYRPSCERLILDTTRPLEEVAIEAVCYLRAFTGREKLKNVTQETSRAR